MRRIIRSTVVARQAQPPHGGGERCARLQRRIKAKIKYGSGQRHQGLKSEFTAIANHPAPSTIVLKPKTSTSRAGWRGERPRSRSPHHGVHVAFGRIGLARRRR